MLSGPLAETPDSDIYDYGPECDHGCGNEAAVERADGRFLCGKCYRNEVGVNPDESIPCPTCGNYEAYLRQAVDR